MSQRELAEAVTAHVFRKTERNVPLDRHYISRLERGRSRWPTTDYRDALRAVLGTATDAELGFYAKRQASGAKPKPRSVSCTPMVTFAGSPRPTHAVRQ
jgi:transcriptional regulator with XRE-family HTH domain